MSKVKHGGKLGVNIQTIHDYIEVHGGTADDLDMRAVAAWGIATGRFETPPHDPLKMYARELSQAAAHDYYVDPQGREVRKMHCYPFTDETGQKRWRWVDIVTAPPQKMQLSLQQRRQSAFRDVVQLATDLASYNDNNQFGAALQMSFNFDEDLTELSQPSEYPDGPQES